MARYSLIIPLHDSQRELAPVLAPLARLSADWEILAVIDGGWDLVEHQIRKLVPQARCLTCNPRRGAPAARNLGACHALGEFLVFIDSDVVVEIEDLSALVQALEQQRELSGIFGCYSGRTPDDHPPISRFRNLLHRQVHRRCAGPVNSFWTGLGALRAQPFFEVGGFDEELSGPRGSTIEDVELGARLTRAGHKIVLDPRFQGVHLKRWSLWEIFQTDTFRRAEPWTRLILQQRLDPSTLNAGWRFRLGPLLLVSAFLLALMGQWWHAIRVLGLYSLVLLPVARQLAVEGGFRVGLASLPGMLTHHLSCCLGASLGWFDWLRRQPTTATNRPARPLLRREVGEAVSL